MPILPCSASPLESNKWQTEFARAFTRIDDLLRFLNLEAMQLDYKDNEFPLRVTRHFANLMQAGDPQDPLLRQVLPTVAEHQQTAGFLKDPTGDGAAAQTPGILQKYRGRALLIATSACAINCRYCFRRLFPYSAHNAAESQWAETLRTLADMRDVSEVILSGGDPLVMDNQKLQLLIDGLDKLPHIKRLRIHSRLPVVLPERMDQGLTTLLHNTRLKTVLVIHANHPNEISDELHEVLTPLRHNDVQVFNQSVLLKGVNDDAETLAVLSERLFDAGITPYYLHLLDRVQGTAHFEVSAAQGNRLMIALRARLPGYMVPRLVYEQPGAASKLPI